jgi:hypothetical protein
LSGATLQLEPPAAGVQQVAVSTGSRAFNERLYWTLGDGTTTALDL